MSQTITLQQLEFLEIRDEQGQLSQGADQNWYLNQWQRNAGCGPTTCSHLLWYLSRRRSDCRALCGYDGSTLPGFRSLMEDVWQHVTPGRMGVNTSSIFTAGARSYGAEHGVPLHCRVLEVPTLPAKRPAQADLQQFLTQALTDDLAVAFLNLSNGSLSNLDHWHWVTLVGLQPATMSALMYDQGTSQYINIGLWLKTTSLGGALVALEPAS